MDNNNNNIFRQYIIERQKTYALQAEGPVSSFVKNLLKPTEKINVTGWKTRVHKGKHPDVKDVSDRGNILFAIDPKTGKEHHIASGNLSNADIAKFKRMYRLK